MTALEVGLVVALALLATVAASLARTLAATTRRLELLERRVSRGERRGTVRSPATPDSEPSTLTQAAGADAPLSAGDAVDIRGATPDGAPAGVPLEATTRPTLLAFLSTTCGICVGMWERLDRGELADAAPGVDPVVVLKDAVAEDVARVRELSTGGVPVVLSTEAWDDYEVPGSPYVMVVSAAPGSVVTEGGVSGWDELVRVAASSGRTSG